MPVVFRWQDSTAWIPGNSEIVNVVYMSHHTMMNVKLQHTGHTVIDGL